MKWRFQGKKINDEADYSLNISKAIPILVGKTLISTIDYKIMLKKQGNISAFDSPPFFCFSPRDPLKMERISDKLQFFIHMMSEAKKGLISSDTKVWER